MVTAGRSRSSEVLPSEEVVSYWRSRLDSMPYLQLPTDYSRCSSQKGQVKIEAEESLAVDETVCVDLLKWSLQSGVKPFTAVLSALSVLMHKYTREEDIVFGSSNSNFNPLVLRVAVQGSDRLEEVCRRVEVIEQEAYANDIPFDKLLQKLQDPSKNPNGDSSLAGAEAASSASSRTSDKNNDAALLPLFQVRMFNVSDVNSETLDSANCEWTFYVEQDRDSKKLLPLNIRVIYNTALYTRDRMREVLEQLQMIVHQIATSGLSEQGGKLVRDTSTASPTAQTVIPDPMAPLDEGWNGSIQSIFSANAQSHPDRVAAVQGNLKYTYREIDALSNRVANYLIGKGIKKEDVVALYAHRSASIIVSIMGILKAGATFTVIDPAYPVQRQTVYLSVAKPRGIIAQALAGNLNPEVQQYIDKDLSVCCQLMNVCMDSGQAHRELSKCSDENPQVPISPNDVGTLSFTSGSTGIPKAVRGRHISLTHFYPWMASEFNLTHEDRFTMLSGIAHDPIQRDVFTPLFLGAVIHIPSSEIIGTPGRLAEWCAEEKVTITHLTPAMGQLLTANASAKMGAFRHAFFVGDVLTKRDVVRLQALAPKMSVINMYGTTETQRAVSYLTVPAGEGDLLHHKDILPSGRGMKDVQLLVMNPSTSLTGEREKFHMCGIGELGEIFVRSPHLSKGYLGLPEETAKKFLANPFDEGVDANGGEDVSLMDRLYRTGDLGRYMSDGTVECIGRADFQVKIRGFRIELGEIDTHLGQHSHVRENVTMVKRDANEEKVIVSYFVPSAQAPNGQPDIQSIREHLKEKLPSYSVPSVFFPLSRMPLTPNGKIDRNKLPFPDIALLRKQQAANVANNNSGDGSEKGQGPLTATQKKVMGIWEDVLGVPVYSIRDNFFEIGGHSIIATRLTFQLRQAFKFEMPLNLLYQYPTVERLANAIENLNAEMCGGYVSKVKGGSSESAADTPSGVNLEAEITLDECITTKGLPQFVPWKENPKGVFLTGATGFLGSFLLHRLLGKYPETKVYCLVRAKGEAEGLERLIQNLKTHLLWAEDGRFDHRIVPVVGDLGEGKFALTDEQFAELAECTDVIYHNGALVHWVYPYAKLKPMNVNGTVEGLRLATTHHIKPFHFISSTSIFDSSYYMQQTSAIKEKDPLPVRGGAGLNVGYGQSKWVSENILLRIAGPQRGIPFTIFRPGYITGESTNGVMNIDDYLVRLIKGCIQLKQAPIMQNRVNMCSVDFVADSIVSIGGEARFFGQAYHIVNPEVYRFSDYFQALVRYGYDVEFVEYVEWRESLMKLTLESKSNALYPLLHFVLDDLPTKSKSPALDATDLFKALASIEQSSADSSSRCVSECPSMHSCMGIYLSYLVYTGYIDMPSPQTALHRSVPQQSPMPATKDVRAGKDKVEPLPDLSTMLNGVVFMKTGRRNV
eukprot:Nk52_evm45s1444 gene=Nk52_evmTU45s1444